MDEVWYAFLISIVCNVIPEVAIDMAASGTKKDNNKFITNSDIEDMIKLKKELTYKELGEIYCMNKDAVYSRIGHYKPR